MSAGLLHTLGANTAVSLGLTFAALAAERLRLRPQIAHVLWLAALVKLVTPPLVPLPLLPAETVATPPAAVSATWHLVRVPAEPPQATSASPSASTEPLPPPAPPRWSVGQWLLGVWLTGSAVWLTVALRRLWRFHRLLRGAEVLSRGEPSLLAVPGVLSPMLWAFLGRARIIVPRELFATLSPPERDSIIRHEQAHFRRRDHWVRWVEFSVLATLWWHPLAWWITRRLRAAEETCCDAEVVASSPEPHAYATALLRTAAFIADATPLPHAATGLGSFRSLQQRVSSIMSLPAPKPLGLPSALTLLSLSTAIILGKPVPQEAPAPLPGPAATPDETPAAPEPPATETAPVPPNPVPDAAVETPARESDSRQAEKRYLSGYLCVQQAESLERAGKLQEAVAKLAEALEIFRTVQATRPDWQANMVAYRVNMVEKKLQELLRNPKVTLPGAADVKVTADAAEAIVEKGRQILRYTGHVRFVARDFELAAASADVVDGKIFATDVHVRAVRNGTRSIARCGTLEVDLTARTATARKGAKVLHGRIHLQADEVSGSDADGFHFRSSGGTMEMLTPAAADQLYRRMLSEWPADAKPPSKPAADSKAPQPSGAPPK